MKLNIGKELYHISFRASLGLFMIPRQPHGTEVIKDTEKGEETLLTTEDLPKRVSFSPTIEQCFWAIYPNIAHFFEVNKYPFVILYVYKLRDSRLTDFIDPKLVLEKVHDSHITEEVCVTSKAPIVKIAKIKIFNPIKNPEILYKKFNNPDNPEEFLSHLIEWKMIEKFRDSQLPKEVTLNVAKSNGYSLYEEFLKSRGGKLHRA